MAPGTVRMNEAVVNVMGFIASEKFAVMTRLNATPTDAAVGSTESTVGAVVSGAIPVVKLHETLLPSAFPAKSFAPVLTVAVYSVFALTLVAGLNVAVTPE